MNRMDLAILDWSGPVGLRTGRRASHEETASTATAAGPVIASALALSAVPANAAPGASAGAPVVTNLPAGAERCSDFVKSDMGALNEVNSPNLRQVAVLEMSGGAAHDAGLRLLILDP
ncbi:hypothetical protein [Actinomadura fibrosa]|uniref:Uncharacterized protein n=1 Tax=Actinomadura fibrosa TaxID=111802 RepID=A0ABW2XF12_9ACTN|nr:hypothetical protein [Actinomadura fibrosa]